MSDQYLTDAFIKDLHGRIAKLESGQIENTTAIQEVRADTKDMVELFHSLEGGFKVIERLGRMARPVGWFAGAAAAVLTLWQTIKGFRG
ncbi:hypothetical protein [Achromobacter marplatensis]|uniref:Uncharacterized protein n=1 Tax=Achromobacter marplatensis TaxID=470868 RepID=A0AA42WC75_9BURK|nr:hypothetical protein [Achromobacter marplatensis]MDH2052528.1 hypothetical protein [Achromobacter marplatensis]